MSGEMLDKLHGLGFPLEMRQEAGEVIVSLTESWVPPDAPTRVRWTFYDGVSSREQEAIVTPSHRELARYPGPPQKSWRWENLSGRAE